MSFEDQERMEPATILYMSAGSDWFENKLELLVYGSDCKEGWELWHFHVPMLTYKLVYFLFFILTVKIQGIISNNSNTYVEEIDG